MSDKSDSSAAALLDALQSVLSEVAKPSQVLKTILGQAVERTGADRGVFVEVSGKGKLTYRVLYRFQRDDLQGEAGRFSRSICTSVLEQGEGLLLGNALDDPRFRNQESVQDLKLISALCVPIRAGESIDALVHLESDRTNHFSPEHREILRPLAEVAGNALAALRAGEGVMRERDAARESARLAREELTEQRELLARDWSFGRFIGRSAAVRELEQAVYKAAKTEFPVLLLGETGTGKSILARVLHHAGPRGKHSLVTVFCPSLEKSMVETELFGHRRGAFTGAVADRVGKVQVAERGTLFLDEIGELPPEIQPKLLRLLQERSYERVGDPTERMSDVRVIAATNRDLEQEVRQGRFRRDLYERLNYVPIRVPPLRARTDDLPLLLRHFLDQTEAGRWVELAPDTLAALCRLEFDWPGNVRHVEQLAVRLAMEAEPDQPLSLEEVLQLLGPDSERSRPAGDAADEAEAGLEAGLPTLLARQEKKWLDQAVRRYPDLTRQELAEKLKISESALYKKLRFYGIGG